MSRRTRRDTRPGYRDRSLRAYVGIMLAMAALILAVKIATAL